jgi:hypothetical protein
MGLLSKIWKGFKKVVKKIGRGIKKAFKKVGKFFGKMGILGHIGMMFIMPYAGAFWGSLGKLGTQLAQGTNLAGKAFGHVMRGIYHAGKAAGTVYKGVTEAISGSMKWLTNKVGLTNYDNPFAGLQQLGEDTQMWLKDGWKGSIEGQSFVKMPDGGKLYHEEMSPEMQEAFKTSDFKAKSLMETDVWKREFPETEVAGSGTEEVTEDGIKEVDTETAPETELSSKGQNMADDKTTATTPDSDTTETDTTGTDTKKSDDTFLGIDKETLKKGRDKFITDAPLTVLKGSVAPDNNVAYNTSVIPDFFTSEGVQLRDIFGDKPITVEGLQSNGYNFGGPFLADYEGQVMNGFENYHAFVNGRYGPRTP